MINVGLIGLGIMGKPMALNIINNGYIVFLHSRSGVPEELKKAGGLPCATPKALAEQADVIVLMLPDTPDVETVLFGETGVACGLRRGKTVVDMSSISPVETKRFAGRIEELGCDYLDAPVSGGQVGAEQGTLTISAQAQSLALPNTALCQQLLSSCIAYGYADQDHSALVTAIEGLAGSSSPEE